MAGTYDPTDGMQPIELQWWAELEAGPANAFLRQNFAPYRSIVRRWEQYQRLLAKKAVLARLESMGA